MTQREQAISALKKIGGRGTLEDIFNAVDGIDEWGAKNPKASLSAILTTHKEFTKDNNMYVLSRNTVNQKVPANMPKADSAQNWLYLITLSYVTRPIVSGVFLIKIGKATGKLASRIKGYSAALPFETVQLLESYEIPSGIDPTKIETLVRQKLEQFKSSEFGFKGYITGHQREWQQVSGLHFSNDNIAKVTVVINKIVNEAINILKGGA